MNNKNELMPSNEIMGAYLTYQLSYKDLQKLKSSPIDMIAEKTGIDLSSFDLGVVENSADEMHLVLPYYSELDVITAVSLSDDDLEAIDGGEIFITLGVLIGGAIGASIGVAAGVTATTGVIVGATVGAAVGAGVAGVAIGTIVNDFA